MNFLFYQAYQCFYEQYLLQHAARIGKNPDFHPSIYAQRDATARAIDVIMQVAQDGRINECYQRRVKELKLTGAL